MNAAHFHLVFTHLPIIGLLIAIFINCYALFVKSKELQRFTLLFYMALSLMVLLAYLTGDGAAEYMRKLPGINADDIETHEHWAQFFLCGVLILSAIAGWGWYVTKLQSEKLQKFIIGLLVAGVVIFVLGYVTGASGGNIRHDELRTEQQK